jgi:hypothetical protein
MTEHSLIPCKGNIFFSPTQLRHWICSLDRFLYCGYWKYTERNNSTTIKRERREIKLSWPTLKQSPKGGLKSHSEWATCLRTQSISFRKANLFMLFRQEVGSYCDSHTIHINNHLSVQRKCYRPSVIYSED